MNKTELKQIIREEFEKLKKGKFHFKASADLGAGKKVSENLDNFNELQKFMNKMITRNAISVEVTAFDIGGERKKIKYMWTGDSWEIKKG